MREDFDEGQSIFSLLHQDSPDQVLVLSTETFAELHIAFDDLLAYNRLIASEWCFTVA